MTAIGFVLMAVGFVAAWFRQNARPHWSDAVIGSAIVAGSGLITAGIFVVLWRRMP